MDKWRRKYRNLIYGERSRNISKDKNDSDTPDIDSIPNNRKPKEKMI